MRFSMLVMMTMCVAMAMGACGKQQQEEEEEPAVAIPSIPPPTVLVRPGTSPVPATVAPQTTAPQETSVPANVPPQTVVKATAAPHTPLDTLVLAQQSGCLACHSVEKKVVGPAWQDVSLRYKGDAQARDKLIAKIKAGGKGNWTEVTGGVPMPPYSPRVSDQNIETLVNFVLSLAK